MTGIGPLATMTWTPWQEYKDMPMSTSRVLRVTFRRNTGESVLKAARPPAQRRPRWANWGNCSIRLSGSRASRFCCSKKGTPDTLIG